MHDETSVDFKGYETAALVRMIFEVANWNVRAAVAGTTAEAFKYTTENIKEAANLVFLAVDLITERK